MEVLVEYEYQALHEDELTLRPGDLIRAVRRVEEEGWMEGELDGRRGLFPDNFVKELKKDGKEAKQEAKEEAQEEAKEEAQEEAQEVCQVRRREKQPGTVANMVQRMSHMGFQPPGHPPAAKKKPRRRQCKVLYDYAPQNQDELELKVGELVDINEEVEEGWWCGSVNGKSGLFPSNFVKELEDEETGGVAMATDETDAGREMSDPTSPGPPGPGPGPGAQPKKVMGFGFGDIFREGSVKLRPRPPSPDKDQAKDKPIPSLPSATKPGPAPGHAPGAPPPPHADSRAQEYCKVTFTFDSTNEDELSLKENDLVHILSKDTGEPGWWRGEINGKEGVFPDNFVTMVTEADKEVSQSSAFVSNRRKGHKQEQASVALWTNEQPESAGSLGPAGRASMTSSAKQEAEEKPKKPPPPSKHTALKPDLSSTERRPHFPRSDDKVDHKPSKPAAPMVYKKPLALPVKNRLSGVPPKRPDKPLTSYTSSPALTPSTSSTPGPPAPTSTTRHNGEVGALRPKSDLEVPVQVQPRTPSGDCAEKSPESDLMSFDALSASSEKLRHPTVDRPKVSGRRPPGHPGGQPTKELEEQVEAKPRLSDTKKPSMSTTVSHPAGFLRTSLGSPEAGGGSSPSVGGKGRVEGEDLASQLEDLRTQMGDLLMSVDLIKTQQTKEMGLIRAELDEERLKRLTLQMEIEKLKRALQVT